MKSYSTYITSLFILVICEVQSQGFDLIGVYRVNWGVPSERYLFLDCDSTYHFITHWDFNAMKDIEPGMADKRKWKVEGQKINLENPVYPKFKTLNINSDSILTHKEKKQIVTWTKVLEFDNYCKVISFKSINSSQNFNRTFFLPDLKIRTQECFTDSKLVSRTTYFILTDIEFDDYIIKKGLLLKNQTDLVMDVILKIAEYDFLWPKEKIETWENNSYHVKYFNKEGQEISGNK